MLRRLAAILAAALALTGGGAVAAAQSPPTLPDVEDEVMCPVCGTPLNLAQAPQAQRQRAFIREQIAAGRSKEEIKAALVKEFGPEVLALPRAEGFSLSAYLVPALGALAAVSVLAAALLRWRRRSRRANTGASVDAAAEPTAADRARLERDLARYDL